MKDKITYSVSEQPNPSNVYQFPGRHNAPIERIDQQPNHVKRVREATHVVLDHRNTCLQQVPDTYSPPKPSGLGVVIELFSGQPVVQESNRAALYRQLLDHEGKIGAELFNDQPILGYNPRNFFCSDHRVWIWVGERKSPKTGKQEVLEIDFTITDTGILKTHSEGQSQYLYGEELDHFVHYTEKYKESVLHRVYSGQRAA